MEPALNRRDFLKATSVVVAATALGACSSEDPKARYFGGQLKRLRESLESRQPGEVGIAFMGDSITWGMGTGENASFLPRSGKLSDARDEITSRSYVNNFRRSVREVYIPNSAVEYSNWSESPSGQSISVFKDGSRSVRISNQGINGARTVSFLLGGMIGRFMIPGDGFVFVQLGTNDRINVETSPHTADILRENYVKIVKNISKNAEVILMCAPPSTHNNPDKFRFAMDEVRKSVLSAAEECKVDFIDNYVAFSGVDLKSALSDGTHPTVLGHKIISDNVMAALRNS